MVNIQWDRSSNAYVLRSEVILPASRDTLFEFFSDAFQLERITPPWLNFKVLTPAPIQIQTGTLIDYRLRLRVIPIRWQTEISSWNPPHSFTDRQLKGPYNLWEHFHKFEEVDGGTLVTDQVRYRVPGVALVHSLFVKRELQKIFQYRHDRMVELFSHSNGDPNVAD